MNYFLFISVCYISIRSGYANRALLAIPLETIIYEYFLGGGSTQHSTDYLERLPDQYVGDHALGEIEILQGRHDGIGVLYEDPYILLVRDRVLFPSGKEGTYLRIFSQSEIENGTTGTVILPVLGKNILIRKAFRHSIRSWVYEIPRGFSEKGSSPEENAIREVKEELGYTVDKVVYLGTVHPDTGILANSAMLYFARLGKYIGDSPEDTEAFADISRVSITEFEKWIETGIIKDSLSINAYCLASLRKLI